MKSKFMRLFVLLLVVLTGLVTSFTPVHAVAGVWSTGTTYFSKDGVPFTRQFYTENGANGEVEYKDVLFTSNKFTVSFPAIPLKGVVKGSVAYVTTEAVIPVTFTNPAKPSEQIVVNMKATITEYTKKVGVWPFQKTVKSGVYAVVAYANLTNFKAFDKTYPKVVANLRVYSNAKPSPMSDSGLYYEKYNLLDNPTHLASPAHLDIKNAKFSMNREKGVKSTTPYGFNFWLYSVNR